MAVAERKVQLAINQISSWANKKGFKFSTSKSVVVHFCRIRGVHPDPDLYLYDQRISCVEEARFLGLIFDKRLTWMPHLKMLKTKCLNAMKILNVLSHTNWGADRQTLLRLYRALILSKLNYGCEIYSSASRHSLKVLDSIHHSGIRFATGAFRSSPIPSLLVDAGEMPLELHRQCAMVRYWDRLKRLPTSLAFQDVKSNTNFIQYDNNPKLPHPFGYRVKQVLEELGLLDHNVCPFKISAVPPWNFPIIKFCRYFKSFKRDLSAQETKQLFLEHVQIHCNSYFIYTDGTKSDAGVGFGVVSENFRIRGALPVSASVFTAELRAILAAVEKVVTLEQKKFTVFSDSKSVLQSLESFNPVHPIVLEIMEWLYHLKCRGYQIDFCWVPAHVDIDGNEKADQLAKEAASELIPRRCNLPQKDFIREIKLSVKSFWQHQWIAIDFNKMREISEVVNPWHYGNMPRRDEILLCRLRIGHTRLTHGFLMSGQNQPYCDDCIVPLTIRHILLECPSLQELRGHFLADCRDEEGNYLLEKILGRDCNYLNILQYLEELGFLDEL